MEGRADPDCRRTYPWDSPNKNEELLSYFKKATRLRHEHSSLRRGQYHNLAAEQNLYVFGRSNAEERLVVALNIGNTPQTLPAITNPEFIIGASGLQDIWNEGGQIYQLNNGQAQGVTIPARSGTVFALRK